jgi:hypothetical protein
MTQHPQVTGRLTGAYRAGHPSGRYPGWAISFEFNEDVIAALKTAVPSLDRSYDPETHEWWIDEKYEEALVLLFPNFEGYLHQLGFDLPE